MSIAYLSPALPALSETFVYEELLAVERRGITVIPVAVRASTATVPAQQALAQRVRHLYGGSSIWLVLGGTVRTFLFGSRSFTALGLLARDVLECGFFRVKSWKLVYQFLAATKLARILQNKHCSHLHVHFADTPGQIAMYASALSDVPFTIMAHANDIFDGGLLLQRKAERAARLLTISEYNCRYLQSLGIPANRLAVVRCGVSFTPHLAPRQRLPGMPFRVGSLGRMVEKKGFDVLLRAVALLKQTGHPIELSLAGDGPLKSALKKLAQDLNITNEVHFEGSLSHDRVANWMQTLDVFALACKPDANGDMDGIPVVLMEAMSQTIPVISTHLSGIPELIAHGKTGLLAEPGDPDDLARQIERLMVEPGLNETLTHNALEHVVKEFGQAVNIDRLLTHFGGAKPPVTISR